MKTRREFLHGSTRIAVQVIALSAASTLLGRAAHGQAKVARVGFLAAGPRPAPDRPNMFLKAFQERLSTLGYVEGETLIVESRFADGDFQRIPALVAELVKLDVRAIFTPGTPAATIVKRETSIPLVMIGDPVGGKLAASMDRPGGSVTGLASNPEQIITRRVRLLKRLVPGLTRAGFVANSESGAVPGILRMTRAAADALQIEMVIVDVRSEKDLEGAFEALVSKGAHGFIHYPVPMQDTRMTQLTETAIQRRLPWLDEIPRNATLGALLGFGPDYPELARRAAEYVDKILKGAQPGDLSIGVPDKFELIANLQTARALGLTIPDSILAEATRLVR
jgi:putative ABC transport system substrate-binding protein